jgi:hypothetical protein
MCGNNQPAATSQPRAQSPNDGGILKVQMNHYITTARKEVLESSHRTKPGNRARRNLPQWQAIKGMNINTLTPKIKSGLFQYRAAL